MNYTMRVRHDFVSQILDAFHATRHPEVVCGDRSPDVVFSEFVGDFVAGIPSDKGETENTLRVRAWIFVKAAKRLKPADCVAGEQNHTWSYWPCPILTSLDIANTLGPRERRRT